jgi:Xaa-Pro aminopeptidase
MLQPKYGGSSDVNRLRHAAARAIIRYTAAMTSHFTKDFFIGNRTKLFADLQVINPLVIVAAHSTLQRSADTTYPFSQDRNFWYLTGCNEPDVVCVMTADEAYFILPQDNQTRDIFDGAISTTALGEISGIQTVYSAREGWSRLKTMLAKQHDVFTCLPSSSYVSHYGLCTNPSRRRLLEKLRRLQPKLDVQDLRPYCAKHRMIKQPAEIAALREAVRITTESLDALRRSSSLETITSEMMLEAAITYEFRSRGAAGHGYTPIVASGKNATTLHYVDNASSLNDGDCVVVDVGAEVENYSADITRVLKKTPLTARQQAVLDAVIDVQRYGCSLLKPGVRMRDFETKIAERMGQRLVGLGLLAQPNDRAGIRRYYPHATSHFLGLDVHDAGDYAVPLQAGMVLTCEPGIYIPEEGIGMRIEDDILITSTGNENLSGRCSYEPHELYLT